MSGVWQIFRCLSDTKDRYGLGRQVISTLRVLLTFLKEGEPPIVYAANKTISARAEGCSERSIRRHLAKLVELGLVQRHSSANGKRYCIACPDGNSEAFGLDLSPLLMAREMIVAAAVEATREKGRVTFLRKRLSALLYRATCALVQPDLVETLRPILRRKVDSSTLERHCDDLECQVREAEAKLQAAALSASMQEIPVEAQTLQADAFAPPTPTPAHACLSFDAPALSVKRRPCPTKSELSSTHHASDLTVNDGQNDRHKNSMEYKVTDSEQLTARKAAAQDCPATLEKIIEANPDVTFYSTQRPKSWYELEEISFTIGIWTGLPADLLTMAIRKLGRRETALRVLSLGHATTSIRNLPAYFNAITIGRRATTFDPFARIFG